MVERCYKQCQKSEQFQAAAAAAFPITDDPIFQLLFQEFYVKSATSQLANICLDYSITVRERRVGAAAEQFKLLILVDSQIKLLYFSESICDNIKLQYLSTSFDLFPLETKRSRNTLICFQFPSMNF